MKTVIVGGVAGGASCAARLRRNDENAEIVLFERGPYISFANCGLPYHVGDVIKKEESLLLQTPEAMKKKFTRIESQSSLRTLVIGASTRWPATRRCARWCWPPPAGPSAPAMT